MDTLATLLDLGRRARQIRQARELGFLLVNDTHAFAQYRQAVLWLADEGVYALSGVVQPEANAPYMLWVQTLCKQLVSQGGEPARTLVAHDVSPELSEQWADWWPAHALWLAFSRADGGGIAGGLLLIRDEPWSTSEMALIFEWVQTWHHAFQVLHQPRLSSWHAIKSRVRDMFSFKEGQRWWRQPVYVWGTALTLLLLMPVRLSVLAPGELVPANPVSVRAPLEGVLDTFHVQPNQQVSKGQLLFGFDEKLIQSRIDVAVQALATAETDYRQTTQQALTDVRYRPQLATLMGKIDEKRGEVNYLQYQLTRARVLAPQAGVVQFDDPSEWIGRPVAVGERIMRIAVPADTEVEAWLPLSDAIRLEKDAQIKLYLNASPLDPVEARMRYSAFDAVQRPDGIYAYRVRATLVEPTTHRVGLKGTAKLYGNWVPFGYWILRRPLALLRATVGY